MNKGNGYEWTQSKLDLTISVMLPNDKGAKDVRFERNGRSVFIGLKGSKEPLVQGELHSLVGDSTWIVDKQNLVVEFDKRAPRWWPCALKGDPEVDVKALIAKEKEEKRPLGAAPPQDPPERDYDDEPAIDMLGLILRMIIPWYYIWGPALWYWWRATPTFRELRMQAFGGEEEPPPPEPAEEYYEEEEGEEEEGAGGSGEVAPRLLEDEEEKKAKEADP